jgi:hypothetical protein
MYSGKGSVIDPLVVDVAKRHFGVSPGDRMRIHVAGIIQATITQGISSTAPLATSIHRPRRHSSGSFSTTSRSTSERVDGRVVVTVNAMAAVLSCVSPARV